MDFEVAGEAGFVDDGAIKLAGEKPAGQHVHGGAANVDLHFFVVSVYGAGAANGLAGLGRLRVIEIEVRATALFGRLKLGAVLRDGQ